MKIVYCLYRVSTKGQVDHDDIPMQRTACRAFAEKMGWTVCKEFYEKGVSGYKVSAQEPQQKSVNLISYWFSCLIDLAVFPMKRHLCWNGL